jgi:chromate transporter
METHLELFVRFAVISLLAFAGGQAALPLVERTVVEETRWIPPSTFGAAVALAYLTPGPMLIVATFVGYQVAGISGALIATLGAFLAPAALAMLAAQQVSRFAQHPVLRRFGQGATPAVIGLLGVTAMVLSRDSVGASWPRLGIVAVVLALGAATRLHPAVLLALGGLLGYFLAGS